MARSETVSTNLFLKLVRGGLWGHTETTESTEIACQARNEDVDWGEVYRLAEEQSVVGLVAAGIDTVNGSWLKVHGSSFVPQEWALQFIGQTLQIEQRNKAMNAFVAELIERLRKADIYAVLVKGQGIAQCYEKPLWRASGDVDLLLSDTNYEKAKALLVPLATDVETEYTHFKHLGMTIDGWVVELHGTLHSRLSARVDRMIDDVQGDVFYGGQVRSVEFKSSNGSSTSEATKSMTRVQVFLPGPDCDVIFLFTHILHHYFFEGIGLRQFCDLCRFLWTYREELNVTLLEKRLREMRLMTEWKTFAAFAVDYLGMPVEAMPLYDNGSRFKVKGSKMMEFVMKVGNFGHNRELRAKNAELRAKNAELRAKSCRAKGYFWRKFKSFWGRLSDMLRHFRIFPLDSIRFFGGVLRSGLHAVVRGE